MAEEIEGAPVATGVEPTNPPMGTDTNAGTPPKKKLFTKKTTPWIIGGGVGLLILFYVIYKGNGSLSALSTTPTTGGSTSSGGSTGSGSSGGSGGGSGGSGGGYSSLTASQIAQEQQNYQTLQNELSTQSQTLTSIQQAVTNSNLQQQVGKTGASPSTTVVSTPTSTPTPAPVIPTTPTSSVHTLSNQDANPVNPYFVASSQAQASTQANSLSPLSTVVTNISTGQAQRVPVVNNTSGGQSIAIPGSAGKHLDGAGQTTSPAPGTLGNVGAGNQNVPSGTHKVAVPVNTRPGMNNKPNYRLAKG